MNTQEGQDESPSGGFTLVGGNGRLAALAVLDRVLAKQNNQKALEIAFERALRENSMNFFLAVVMPLLPSQARVKPALDLSDWKPLDRTPPTDGPKWEKGVTP